MITLVLAQLTSIFLSNLVLGLGLTVGVLLALKLNTGTPLVPTLIAKLKELFNRPQV